MKKNTFTLLLAALAVFSGASVAQAAGIVLSTDLKKGSSGNEVAVLQTALLSEGFHIPSLESGAVSKGYFGNETFKAVQQYQAAHSVPSTGFVGPLTRASLAKGTGVTTAATPIVPASDLSISTPGAQGTLAITLQATPSNGTNVSKGQQADVATYKLQAGASDMRLSSIALDINNRLWLYASSISLLENGVTVGQVNNLRAADFTELTVGSNYRINIPANLVIKKGTARYLTVRLDMLNVSDRASAVISITRIETRATDGSSTPDNQALSSVRTVSYTGNSNGQVVVTLNPQSPPDMVAPISTSGPTDNVVLGIADFKSESKDSTMRRLTLYMNANFDLSATPITSLFDDIKVQSGNQLFSADSIGDFIPGYGTEVIFSDLDILLPKDKMVPIAVLVKVKQNVNNSLNGKTASSSFLAMGTEGGTDNNPYIEDANHTTVAINTTPVLTSDITFTSSNSSVNYEAPVLAQLGGPVVNGGAVSAYPVTFGFSMTAGDNPLYISSDPSQALATSSSGLPSSSYAQLPLGGMTVTPGNLAGDTNTSSRTGHYIIPAGSTRNFIYSGTIRNTGGTSGLKTFSIDMVRYGTSPSNLTANNLVYYNYAAFSVHPVF